ncbi:ABC transporter substrate-binding protein [Desulfonatronum thioautotrophicum]|uniref:ABC transporter substrate-binding protein n=1 Tax=Desulfonatronum thioautotrophicum TaxID=617001 RepID=UPI0009FDBA45|nr:ABC transporter substrate-binding protein [Desulfonatronum thioautotrophicum]
MNRILVLTRALPWALTCCVVFLGFGLVSPAMAEQAPGQTRAISVNQFVEHPALDSVLRGFQEQLREEGFQVEYRVHNAQANMATANLIARQIVGERPDLVLAIATPSAQAMAQTVKMNPSMQRTPILFSAVTDPLGAGLVKDLQHPGENITGTSDLTPMDQHLALIREIHPELTSLGVIYNSGEANSRALVNLLRAETDKAGITLEEATVARSSDVFQSARSLVGRAQAVYVPTDNTVVSAFEALAKVCQDNKLPLYAADVDSVPRGAVAALGFDYFEHGRQAGAMAARIFRGAEPATTPVETQQDLKLHINLPAARAMGVTIPQAVLDRAVKIIE